MLLLIFALIFSPALYGETLVSDIRSHCTDCETRLDHTTGAYILEYGEEALMSRAWLTHNARKTIDVQYFIWSTDNVGILASEALLSAAERGVRVRVLVDDLLVDAEDKTLLCLAAHPNVEIRIYNPQNTVGTSTVKRLLNVVTNFRGVNQRMHDKTAIFDNAVGITGGRNMADEYFDYDQAYNFRDRDILLLGKAVGDMTASFEKFWASELSVPVEDLLNKASQGLTVAGEVHAREERELGRRAAGQRTLPETRRRRYARHHLDEAVPRRIGIERRRVHAQDRRSPGHAAHRLNGRRLRVLETRGIELRERVLVAQDRHATEQDRTRDDREDLTGQELFVGVEEVALPRVGRERRARLDEPARIALLRGRLLFVARLAQKIEDARDADGAALKSPISILASGNAATSLATSRACLICACGGVKG